MISVRRINARRQLFRQIQEFFERELHGLWTISDMAFDAPELLPKERGRRQLYREIVSGHFGLYRLTLSSPEEKPPLGEIVCEAVDGVTVRGPLDPTTWAEIARRIKLSETGEHHVVGRRRPDGRGASTI
jgi:hypothetical protein